MGDTHFTVPVPIQRLIKNYERETKDKEQLENAQKVEITEAIGRVAFLYEKVRNAVDYKEENLLVKTAIERILKRRFVPGTDPASIAKPLVAELIRGGYVGNKTLPQSKLEDIAKTCTKYARLLNKAIPSLDTSQREEVFDWSIRMLACELEDVIQFSWERQGMIEFIYSTMLGRVQVLSKRISDDERKVQIYIATLRTYAQYDFDLTSYHLLKYFYPDWQEGKEDEINRVARNILSVKTTIENQIHHPLQDRLARQLKKVNIVFIILHDILKKHDDKVDLLQKPDILEEEIEIATQEKYKEVKSRLRRTSLRSIIYLFITKMALALILELPYDYIFIGHLNYIPLGINVLFHPLLLFFIALTVHIPAKENTQKIIDEIKDLVYDYDGKEVIYQVRPAAVRGMFANFIFRVLYFLAFVITFGTLITLLFMLQFNWLGGLLFMVFLTLVSFFGIRVRQIAKELVVLDRRTGLIGATIDFFSIPIIRAGRWLSVNFSKINVFVFILDVIIEAPFKLIVEVFEDWFSYIREKREEIYD